MKRQEAETVKHPRLKFYIYGLIIMWTSAAVAGLVWTVNNEKSHTTELAHIQAKIAYEKDLIYRRWNAEHGGVYAPVTEDTQPSPYMVDIPERDIKTGQNKTLTLINPDYMFRQAHEMAFEESSVLGHMTSLKPTSEETSPDPWEAEALQAFERGEKEVGSVQVIAGREYMRLMLPLYTEEGCMQCHAKQVSGVGDIRGGLSVAVPLGPLKIIESRRLVNFLAGIFFIWLVGMTGIILAGRRLVRSDRECRLAEGRLIRQHNELQIMNNELQIINTEMEALNSISSAVSQTIDLSELLNIILKTITGLELFNVERKGGIFIIEGDRLNLVAHIGHSEDFLTDHKHVKIGECLCGRAAKTGQIITSMNSDKDHDHTNRYHGMTPHGHIVIPLKTMNGIIGVLCLYTPHDIDIKKHKIALLQSIGNQIGTAIENSRLYEETKALSLHDPLTGLANRRMMHIVFGRNLARAKRLEKPLSIIMLDVDHFKKYNDTYGHAKGDELLYRVANILLKETREIDLVARYGGEEFFIMIPEADLPTACEVAERIRNAVESMTDVTVSFGISSYSTGMEEDDLIKKADSALYQAKNKGRNRVEVGL